MDGENPFGRRGISISRTVPTKGVFSYHCLIHQGMNGSVRVHWWWTFLNESVLPHPVPPHGKQFQVQARIVGHSVVFP